MRYSTSMIIQADINDINILSIGDSVSFSGIRELNVLISIGVGL